jgi:hypothetical protein
MDLPSFSNCAKPRKLLSATELSDFTQNVRIAVLARENPLNLPVNFAASILPIGAGETPKGNSATRKGDLACAL